MGFTIPASYPVPLENQGVPNKIRAATMLTLLERDRFIFANQRRMLTSLSPFFTASAGYVKAAVLWVHNSKLTQDKVTAVAFGYNANVKITVNGVTATEALGTAPDFFTTNIVPGWTDDTWVEILVEVQSTSGTGGYKGLYILEDPLLEATLP
jgi:hypothetical protein